MHLAVDNGYDFDMIVIGGGAAGQKAAISATKAGRRALLVEKKGVVGGACINTGTIPSKSLREAVLYLSGWREHAVYGISYAVKHDITMQDLLLRAEHVVRSERDVLQAQLCRNGVAVVYAGASFVDPHTVRLTMADGSGTRTVNAAYVVIATGTEAARVTDVPVDGCRIFTSDNMVGLASLPMTGTGSTSTRATRRLCHTSMRPAI